MAISQLFNKTTFIIPELIKCSEIPNDNDLNSVLLEKVKKKIGNKCIQHGFIDKDSIKIIERTIGKIKSAHFNGNIHYNVKLEMNICQPTVQSRIKCTVMGKNQAGVLCIIHPLQIMLSPEINDEQYLNDNIQIGDEIIIEIIKSKIMINTDSIRVLGKFISKV